MARTQSTYRPTPPSFDKSEKVGATFLGTDIISITRAGILKYCWKYLGSFEYELNTPAIFPGFK